MKINKSSLLLGLVIGIIIGGVIIGLLDVNRPKPLFSRADGGCDALKAELLSIVDVMEKLDDQQIEDDANYNDDAIDALGNYGLKIRAQFDAAECPLNQ